MYYTYIYIYIHRERDVYIYIYMYTCIYTCMDTCVYIYIYIYICMYIYAHIYIYIYTQRERERDTHIYVYMYVFRCVHPVSITRFPLTRLSPGSGLLRNPFLSQVAKIFQGLGPKRRKSCNGDRVYIPSWVSGAGWGGRHQLATYVIV